MINQIALNSADKNAFAPLQNNDVPYAITKPFTDTQKLEVNKEKEKKSNMLGYNIAALALITVLGTLVLFNRLPKNARKSIDKSFKYLEEKSAQLLDKNKRLNWVQNFYLSTLKGAKVLINKSKAIFNLAPLKDVLALRACQKVPFLGTLEKKITAFFEKVSVATSKRAYEKTLIKFDKMFAEFSEASSKISKLEVSEVERLIKTTRGDLTDAFSETARNNRLKEMKKDLEGIDKKVWDTIYHDFKKFLTSKSTYETFISEELAAGPKLKFGENVTRLREKISISDENNYHVIKKLLNNIDTFVDPTDKTSRNLIKNIRNNLADYKKAVKAGQNTTDFIKERGISAKLDELNSYILKIGKEGKYDAKTTEQVSSCIKNLNKVLVESRKGEIQKIMDIYRKALSREDYMKLEKSVSKTLESLDKAVDSETDKLFDKVRDLLIGSAPNDVLHILLPMGVIAWGLSKAKDNDERISIALKTGIPIIGGIATALYCAIALIPSGPSLLIGAISGFGIEGLGILVDKMRKKYKNKENLPLSTPALPSIDLKSPGQIIQSIKEYGST